jgi:hypothetical protein
MAGFEFVRVGIFAVIYIPADSSGNKCIYSATDEV